MRYILMPFTLLLWFLTAYYGLYFTVYAMAFVFSLSWFWLILGYIFWISIIFGILNGIPGLLRYLILKLYGINWFSCIVHSLAGLVGVVVIILFFSANPPELVTGDEAVFMLTGMWELAPLKTIFVGIPFLGVVISVLWSTIISPIYIKLKLSEEQKM